MKRIIFIAILIIVLGAKHGVYAQECGPNPMHSGTITPFEVITLGLPSPLETAPLDAIHIHQKTVGQQNLPFQGGPGIRLSYGILPDLTFGQLALVQDTNINSTCATVGDLLLRAGCRAKDLVLLTQNNQSAIRFATSHPETSIETERMTILNNGNVGVRTTTPLAHFSVGQDFGINSNGDDSKLGLKELTYNRVPGATVGTHIRSKQGASESVFFSPDGRISLNSYGKNVTTSPNPYPAGGLIPNDPRNTFYLGGDDAGVSNSVDGTLMKITTSDHPELPSLVYIKNKVFIGTDRLATGVHPPFQPSGSYMLAVKGSVLASELVIDARATTWADFVFSPDYYLPPIDELEIEIRSIGHLPGIPTSEEVEKNGIAIGDMQGKFLQKIEELTLYVIHLNKENEILKNRVTQLEQKNNTSLDSN
ncbi:MAG TPA: hypothetical protein VIX80_00625 [Candidatus Kapabacteria bacterium]